MKFLAPSLLFTASLLSAGFAHADEPLAPQHENPDLHLSLIGIGSLYWAAQHPTQAWRVVLPIQADDGPDLSADLKTLCTLTFSSVVRVPRAPACP